jgi:division protein CdvB (Snf7/Vps24/ESCRT-III family)
LFFLFSPPSSANASSPAQEKAKIYVGEAIRNKHMSVQYVNLSARIEAVADRVQLASRMKTFAKSIGNVTGEMENALKTMDPVRITAMMDKFETQFQNMDVASGAMGSAIDSSMATSVPDDEVAKYMEALKEQQAMKLQNTAARMVVGSSTAVAPSSTGPQLVPAGASAPPAAPSGPAPGGGGDAGANSLEAQLRALRGGK